MAKMTKEMIEELYRLGKEVYLGNSILDEAVKKIITKYSTDKIAASSAEYYIQLVGDYINGNYKSWNQNSNLILYYVEMISKDFGIEALQNATHAALEFAERNRPSLTDRINNLIIELNNNEETTSIGSFYLPDTFADQLSRRYVKSLLAKPFVILTGNSGTGKTRLATKFAKCLEVKIDDETNCEFVPVGADWTDNTAMLGYYNPMGNMGKGEYVDTPILRLLDRANRNPEYPFFLILDEMNLSHVERYFSDFLSLMETTRTSTMITGLTKKEINYPDNLFVIGTVNIDETTYMFSPKVLDRANVIEFKPEQKDVIKLFENQEFTDNLMPADISTIKAFMSLARKIRNDNYKIKLSSVGKEFDTIYTKLKDYDFEFAYRTVKEICRYFYAAREIDGNNYNQTDIIDEQIVQKLLPKIYGNKRAIGQLIIDLLDITKEKYTLSNKKLVRMQKKLESTQYVSFI